MNAIWTKYLPRPIRQQIEGRHNLQKIIGNTGWLFADKVVRMGVGVLVVVWIARYLGPEQFGLLNYATAFVALFATIASLGLEGIVVRDIVRSPEQKDEILGTAFLLRLIGALLTLILTAACASLIRPGDTLTQWLVVIIAAGTIFQSFDTIDYWFQSQVQSKYTVVVKNTAFLIATLLKIVLLLIKAPLIAFALVALAEVTFGAIGLLFAYRVHGQYLRSWSWNGGWAQRLLKDSWPMIFSGMVIAIYMKIDQIMLGDMVGNEAVGMYSAAVRISEIWYFIPVAIVTSVFPTIIRAKQQSNALYLQRIQHLYTILVWMALSVAVPLTFLSTAIITKLFGHQYAPAGAVLSIHIWTAVFTFFGIGKGAFIQAENMQLFSLICTSSGAIVNVLLNIILIRRYEIMGAAVATLCAQIASALVIPVFYSKDRISIKLFFKSFVNVSELWRVRANDEP
jgi:polysaccharide transporter, PST family